MTLAPEDLAYVRFLIRRDTGVVLDESKSYLIESRLRTRARAENLGTSKTLLQRMRRPDGEDLRHRLVEDILVGETQFFRDRHPFEALASTILPELIELRRDQRRLDLWSAACSTGQEPYSLAMLLQDEFPGLSGWTVRILATDFSQSVLTRAREGTYRDVEIARGLDPALRERHFRREGEGWRLTPQVRNRVQFSKVNLLEAWKGLPRMDLVLLRNVMIYFDAATRASILERIEALLRPGGTLLLGSSETLVGVETALVPTRIGRTMAYRRPV